MVADAYVGDLAVALNFTAKINGVAQNLTGATLNHVDVVKPTGARATITTTLAAISAVAGTYSLTVVATAPSAFTEPGTWSFQLQSTTGGVIRHYDVETKQIGETT